MLYFNSDRPGGIGGQDFYRTRLIRGRCSEPQPVLELNTGDGENDLFVDSQERFVIFNRFVNANRSLDLYIAFRNGDRWGTPRLLDNLNDTTPAAWELSPSISPERRTVLLHAA